MCSPARYPPLPLSLGEVFVEEFAKAYVARRGYGKTRLKPDDLAEAMRKHEARMAEAHASTMRGARVGTALLLALLGTATYALADWLGWLA